MDQDQMPTPEGDHRHPQAAPAEEDPQRLAHLIDEISETHRRGSSALVIGVHAGGQTVVRGYGQISEDKPAVPDATTMFEIGSITKVFTSLLLADMAHEGLVALDDELSTCMPPDVHVPMRDGHNIRLVDLATHRSGLPSVPRQIVTNAIGRRRHNPYADFSTEDLHRALSRTRLRYVPGSHMAYSNMGAALLGEALARRAGSSYEELISKRITGPLGMSDTVVTLSPDQLERLAQGHSRGGRPRPLWDLPAFAGAGALRSCAADMLVFLRTYLDPPDTALGQAVAVSLIPRATVRRHHQIGLAWLISVQPRSLYLIYWHNGGTGGYRSFAGFCPRGGAAVVALAAQARPVDRLCLDLMERLAVKPRELPAV